MSGITARTKHFLGLLMAALILISGLTLVGGSVNAQSASAESSSTPTAEYPWAHNGCTGVTDYPGSANFTYACNHHDGCYGGHWADRATCDKWFLNDMMNYCSKLSFFLVTGCVAAAYPYYWGVRAFGQKYYDAAGVVVRINTPMRVG
jgi:hypothetical protein